MQQELPCSLRKAHAGAGSWQEVRSVGDPCCCNLFLKDCTPWEGPMLKQFVKDYPMGGTTCWSRKKLRRKEQLRRYCGALTASPIPRVITGRGGRTWE